MHATICARLSAKLVGLALIAVLGAAAPAAATTMTATWTGTVRSAIDSSGVFGTVGADLAGSDYTLVFTMDSTAGSYSTFSVPGFNGDQIFGGVTANLTINGQSHAFSGPSSPTGNREIVSNVPTYAIINHQVAPTSPQFEQAQASLSSTAPGSSFPGSIFTAITISSCVACTASLSFDIATASFGNFHGVLDFGALTVAAVPISTTPIPATLPLMVSALGTVGFLGWRRRRAKF
ncbi:hypothetical protein [Dongia sedimenti]|uniref:Secreted protein n=1 Tax=Dongia sedimenti TaxID=3064282 RepID=A0ABU0YHK9_9PROT|nr:hypothetical protein [Rhodospirillaceae bacterium R-7]